MNSTLKDFEAGEVLKMLPIVIGEGNREQRWKRRTFSHTHVRAYGQRRVNKRVVRKSNVGAVSFNSGKQCRVSRQR